MKAMVLTFYGQNHLRPDWFVDIKGQEFQYFLAELQVRMPVSSNEVALFEESLGRQDDIGFPRRIGEEFIDHNPKIQLPDGLQGQVRFRV